MCGKAGTHAHLEGETNGKANSQQAGSSPPTDAMARSFTVSKSLSLPRMLSRPSFMQRVADYPDTLRYRYWRKHRGSGIRPIVAMALDAFLSPQFSRAVRFVVVVVAVGAILMALQAQRLRWPIISAAGMILDIAGVLLVFKEWVLQHSQNEAQAYLDIDRRLGSVTEDEPWVFTGADDEPHPSSVARHMADGLRERLAEHIMPALGGIACLCLGFAFQFAGVVFGVAPPLMPPQ